MAKREILSVEDLIDEAEEAIETISVKQALALHGNPDVAFIDLRDTRELDREGRIPGAIHIPRGMMEFRIDPRSASHHEVFSSDKRFVFFCAGGVRSALAAFTAQRMGLEPVCHIAGGYGAWKRAGGPVELPEQAPGEYDAAPRKVVAAAEAA